jgi:anti-anti-sigma factor
MRFRHFFPGFLNEQAYRCTMAASEQTAVTIALRGALDINSREALRRQLSAAQNADQVVIDLSNVTYAGTTLINALLALRQNMRRRGTSGRIRLIGADAQLRKILAITCLDSIFDVA